MSSSADILRDIEYQRLRALVDADPVVLDALHVDEFVLVNPSGVQWSREDYIGGVLEGRINYRRFEAISEIEVMTDGDIGVLRYRSAIDIAVRGEQPGELECWHTDCYRRSTSGSPWRVVWSQATASRATPHDSSSR